MKENCLLKAKTCLKQKQCLKVERWGTMKGRKKYKIEHQVREVKIRTTLYSINHCQNETFSKKITFLVYASMFVNSYCTTT